MRRKKTARPKKPRPNFPLFPHLGGSWVAVISGRQKAFGGWAGDPQGAAAYLKWREFTDAQKEGRSPRNVTVGLDLDAMFTAFLEEKKSKVKAGEIEPRTYEEYAADLSEFARSVGETREPLGLSAKDFEKATESYHAAGNSPATIGGKIGNVRSAFLFAEDQGLIEHLPRYGQSFKKPSRRLRRRAVRLAEAEHGKKLFGPELIRKMLKRARPTLKACILLGLNCGFLAVDCARLDAESIKGRWLEFIRQKTETFRAAVLWPETIKAIRAASNVRIGVLFKTKRGMPLVHDNVTVDAEGEIEKVRRSDSLNQALADLLNELGEKRKGVNFGALRKTYRTAADEVPDRNAVLITMGHAFPGMDEFYVREVAEPRLKRVSDHVRQKLLKPQKTAPAGPATRNRRRR